MSLAGPASASSLSILSVESPAMVDMSTVPTISSRARPDLSKDVSLSRCGYLETWWKRRRWEASISEGTRIVSHEQTVSRHRWRERERESF